MKKCLVIFIGLIKKYLFTRYMKSIMIKESIIVILDFSLFHIMIQLQKPSYTHWLIESSVSLNIFFNVYRTFSEIVNYLMSCLQASIHYTQSSTKENDTFEFILYEKVKDKVYNCLKFLISVRPLRYKRLWQELIFFPLYHYTIALFPSFSTISHNTMFKTIHTNN